jgi:hypothetical protein
MWRPKGTDPRRLWIPEKLAAACRKVSRRAAVARRKRNVFRKIRTQRNCALWKELAAAGRRMTHSTKVARRMGHNRKRYDQNNVVQETWKGQTGDGLQSIYIYI